MTSVVQLYVSIFAPDLPDYSLNMALIKCADPLPNVSKDIKLRMIILTWTSI